MKRIGLVALFAVLGLFVGFLLFAGLSCRINGESVCRNVIGMEFHGDPGPITWLMILATGAAFGIAAWLVDRRWPL